MSRRRMPPRWSVSDAAGTIGDSAQVPQKGWGPREGREHWMRIRVLPRYCMPPRSRLCRRSAIGGWPGLSHRRAARAPPPAQPPTGRTHLTAGRVGASLAARPFGPRWRGPARRAGWLRHARGGASDRTAAGARRRVAR
eukprot:scaffold16079_cov38-Phaeocystis_antarctica.AAC.2